MLWETLLSSVSVVTILRLLQQTQTLIKKLLSRAGLLLMVVQQNHIEKDHEEGEEDLAATLVHAEV